jgi:signal transduction histidine kinase
MSGTRHADLPYGIAWIIETGLRRMDLSDLRHDGVHSSGHRPQEALVHQVTVADPESKLAQAAEALRKCDEHATAGRLALEVMHDIRNPIEALRNLNYLTGLSPDDPEAVRRFAGLAEEQLTIATGIANSVLAFTHATNQPKPVNLVLLAEAALRIHQRAIEAKKVRLLKDLQEDAIASVYTSEMLQVISNLIHNAVDALPQDGILRLRLRKAEGEIHLLIADNGHGIPAEYADEIFEPFFTTKEERTGLGLALTKRIVERHRGTIKMRSSVRPGRSGTLFKISLPV